MGYSEPTPGELAMSNASENREKSKSLEKEVEDLKKQVRELSSSFRDLAMAVYILKDNMKQ